MAGIRGNYRDSVGNYWAEDVNQDTACFLANDAAILQLVFGNWNVLLAGAVLSAGAGMTVNVSAWSAVAQGVVISGGAAGVALAAANPSLPRYDVVYARVSTGVSVGTNATSGNPVVQDTSVLGVWTGTAAALPAKPTLPDGSYVQLASVYVPAGAATAGACTLNSQDTSPNAQGPVNTLVDLKGHIAGSFATQTIHGYQAAAGGGLGAGKLLVGGGRGGAGGLEPFSPLYANTGSTAAQDGYLYVTSNGPTGTDGLYLELARALAGNTANVLHIAGAGAVNLDTLWLHAGIAHVTGDLRVDGTINGGASGQFDPSGAAAAVQAQLNTETANRQSQDTALQANVNGVQNNLNDHAAQSLAAATVHGVRIQAGTTASAQAGSDGRAYVAVTFPHPFGAPPVVVANFFNDPGNATRVTPQSVTATGCVLNLGIANTSGEMVNAVWIAVGV